MSEYKNIHNMNYASQMWDWEPYNDCFKGKIRMGDNDGMVERKGYFLVVETKQPNTEINFGQRLMYEALAKHPNFTVIYLWGELNKPTELQYVGKSEKHTVDIEGVKKHFSDWFNRVDTLQQYDPTPREITKDAVWEWIKNTTLAEMTLLFFWLQDLMKSTAKIEVTKDKAA
jgi:hypothetical protein